MRTRKLLLGSLCEHSVGDCWRKSVGKSPIQEDGKPIYNATCQVLSAWEPEGEKEAELAYQTLQGVSGWDEQTKEDGVSWRERETSRLESKGANSTAGEGGLLP